jgi:hypothetical protein
MIGQRNCLSSDKMPTCIAIKGSGETCGRGVGIWNAVPDHLHFCGIHHRTYQQRVAVAGHHVVGRCQYYATQHWCEHDAAQGGILCPRHVVHIDSLLQRARRRADVEERIRLLRVEMLNEQPPRPWRALVDDLLARNLPDNDVIRFRAGLEVYLIRDEGPQFHFNRYWVWAEGGRQGPEPGFPDLDIQVPQDRGLRAIARDAQNVHTTVVSRQTNSAVEKLLAVQVPKEQQTEKAMVRSWIALLPTSWHTILRTTNDVNKWFNTKTCREHEDHLYRKLLRGLVATIDRTDNEMRPELYKRLWEECTESVGLCCEGHMSRLCNVMVGFDDAFKPPVSVGDILQQKMAAIAGLDVAVEMKHTHAAAVFDELGIPAEQRQPWLDAF